MLRRTVAAMPHRPPLLDMTPDGDFRPLPALGWKARVFLATLGASFVVGIVASAALVIYAALLLLPVAIVAAAVRFLAPQLEARRGPGGHGSLPS